MRCLPPFVLIGLSLFALVLITQAVVETGSILPRPFHVEPHCKVLTSESVTVAWSTLAPKSGHVEYGPTAKLGYTIANEHPATEQALRVEGLKPDTIYFYRVQSGDHLTATRQFRTPPSGPRFHVEPYLQLPAPDGMTIMWETSVPLAGEVEYGPTPELGRLAREQQPPCELHQVRLTGLAPGDRCHYRVRCGPLVSRVNSFRTAPPPGTGKWRMALYGDSRSNPFVHRKVVEQIAKADVDLILHTGDIVLSGKNYDLWRLEFFAPLAPVAGSVPWVSTIGNHEQDAENYFSYVALPGNERYFGFDFGNTHIVCLDSNGWIERGRDSKQFRWMDEHLKAPRSTTWTFVAFHHPLFSAHRDRGINPLRWDWAPLFLDPNCRVDAVLSGHDHFYARCHMISRVAAEPHPGVLFLTSAGGGASLYPIRQRDYVALTRSVHHFTLFDFEGDQVTITPIDTAGREFDRLVLRKQATPPQERCAFEVEELKNFIRKALHVAPAIEVNAEGVTEINTVLQVPTRFTVPVAGSLRWTTAPGWELLQPDTEFKLAPLEPLKIPLQARLTADGFLRSPLLTIEFEPGLFLNRRIELSPFKLTGSSLLPVRFVSGVTIDGNADEAAWQPVARHLLLGERHQAPSGPPGTIGVCTDGSALLVTARLRDPSGKISVPAPESTKASTKLVLSGEHFRVEIHDGKRAHLWALSPEQIPYYSVDGKDAPGQWRAIAGPGHASWQVELAIPLNQFPDRANLRINLVHRSRIPTKEWTLKPSYAEFEMRPTFGLGANPDVIPDWKSVTAPDQFARLRFDGTPSGSN
jgi:hypothetical protein